MLIFRDVSNLGKFACAPKLLGGFLTSKMGESIKRREDGEIEGKKANEEVGVITIAARWRIGVGRQCVG